MDDISKKLQELTSKTYEETGQILENQSLVTRNLYLIHLRKKVLQIRKKMVKEKVESEYNKIQAAIISLQKYKDWQEKLEKLDLEVFCKLEKLEKCWYNCSNNMTNNDVLLINTLEKDINDIGIKCDLEEKKAMIDIKSSEYENKPVDLRKEYENTIATIQSLTRLEKYPIKVVNYNTHQADKK